MARLRSSPATAIRPILAFSIAKAAALYISLRMPPLLERSPHSDTARALRRPRARLTRLFHLWHLLSFDAPSVATLWTALIAQSCGIHLPAINLLAMFLAVWTLYAADRLLDAQPLHRHPTATGDLELRHLFHHRHRRSFLLALGVATVSLAALIPLLPPAALRLFLILGTLLAGYFVLIHATSGAHRLPKELAVGLFFSAAAFIPTVARVPSPHAGPLPTPQLARLPLAATDPRLALAPLALLFAALCCLNCLCIYAWEHASPPFAAPHRLTEIASRHRRTLAVLLLLASLLAVFASSPPAIPVAIALSAVALLLLDRHRLHLGPLTLRAAADLALTTPVLFLPGLVLTHIPHR